MATKPKLGPPKIKPPISVPVEEEDVKAKVDAVYTAVSSIQADGLLTMDDLEFKAEVARGQGGVVKRVIHKATGDVYALKIIPLQVSDDTRNRIVQELQLLHTCACPCIVDFAGAFFREGDLCLCMEFMDAGSLLDVYQKAGKIPEEVLGAITVNVIDALCYLKSEHQIMHRDIKPANILINTQGQVKLCDLGVSGQLQNSVAVSSVGTIMYFAPERIDSTGGEAYTVQADVWSFGVTIAEMALGFYPYPKRDPNDPPPTKPVRMGIFDVLTHIVHGEPTQLPESDFSPEFCSFINACLTKDVAQRPTPAQLTEHPFYLTHKENMDVEAVATWVQGVLEASAAAKAAAAAAEPAGPAQ